MKIKLLSSARKDLLQGLEFYEEQQAGLGQYFLESISSDIDSLKEFPGIHSIHFSEYHRKPAKNFPYAIFYKIEENQIVVHAIIDCRRDPKRLERRFD